MDVTLTFGRCRILNIFGWNLVYNDMTFKRSLPPDPVLIKIADYVVKHKITHKPAYAIARYCLLDSLACAFDALAYPECNKLLARLTSGSTTPWVIHGAAGKVYRSWKKNFAAA